MAMKSLNAETLEILTDGQLECLTDQGFISFHRGNATWGASVGCRAMQAAGLALSNEKLWDRNLPGTYLLVKLPSAS
jgi:hypothetical protein